MKNVLKITFGALLFSGLLFFNLNDNSSSESSSLSTMSLEQTTVYADGARQPYTRIDGVIAICYNQLPAKCPVEDQPILVKELDL